MGQPAAPTRVPVPVWHRIIGVIGLLGQLGLLVFYAASGLVAPAWAIVVLMVIWLALLIVAIRLFIRRPLLVPIVPVVAFGIWYGAISLGEALLHWQA